MFCPFCSTEETKVIDSRLVEEGARVRRRRECVHCRQRFTTYEEAALAFPRIIKRDGRRVEFDETKLHSGMIKALEKRPVSTELIQTELMRIKQDLRSRGEREVESDVLGELVMAALRQLDQVAFVRFASIYRSFEDVDAFKQTIKSLEDHYE